MNINFDIYEFQDQAKQVQKDNFKSKQENIEVQQQIQILKNRLLMLQNEESKQEGQIKNHQKKIQKIIEVNKNKKQIKEIKLKIQENQRQYCLEKLDRAQTLKHSTTDRIKSLRENILQDKQTQFQISKKLSKINDQKIYQIKLEHLQNREENVKVQKQKLMNKREKLLTFWENKYQNFIDNKINQKNENQNEKKIYNQQLQKLLNQENQQIQQLQQSLELKRKLQGLDIYQQILE